MITAGAMAISHGLAPRLAAAVVGYGIVLSLMQCNQDERGAGCAFRVSFDHFLNALSNGIHSPDAERTALRAGGRLVTPSGFPLHGLDQGFGHVARRNDVQLASDEAVFVLAGRSGAAVEVSAEEQLGDRLCKAASPTVGANDHILTLAGFVVLVFRQVTDRQVVLGEQVVGHP
jgi:hypothetical protein